jgi:membrane-associated protein
MFDIFASVISPENIIQSGGILLVAAVIFAESGLLIGFFLPGDTLLFAAGLAASQGRLPLFWLIAAVVIAAIIGDNVGYSIGRHTGHRLFKKKESLFFQHEHIKRAEKFYEAHGGKTIIMARFIPIVRTFAPVVAGIGKMPRERFLAFNVIGGLLWGVGMPLLGYYLGSKIPHLDKYIEWVLLGVIVLSICLSFAHLLKEKDSRRIFKQKVHGVLRKVFLNKRV